MYVFSYSLINILVTYTFGTFNLPKVPRTFYRHDKRPVRYPGYLKLITNGRTRGSRRGTRPAHACLRPPVTLLPESHSLAPSSQRAGSAPLARGQTGAEGPLPSAAAVSQGPAGVLYILFTLTFYRTSSKNCLASWTPWSGTLSWLL